jgi:hypothetical protein
VIKRQLGFLVVLEEGISEDRVAELMSEVEAMPGVQDVAGPQMGTVESCDDCGDSRQSYQ